MENKYGFKVNKFKLDKLNSKNEKVFEMNMGEGFSPWDLDGVLKYEYNLMDMYYEKDNPHHIKDKTKIVITIELEL